MADLSVETSLAYHAEIAVRLAANPGLLAVTRARIAAWGDTRTVHPRWVDAWRELVDGPPGELLSALVRDDERMRDLRQVTPFAGILSPRERLAIWRRVRARAA